MDNNRFSNLNFSKKGKFLTNGGASATHTISSEIDYIIPESIYDAEKILLVSSAPILNEKSIMGNHIFFSGQVKHNILLLGEDGSINSLSYDEKFDDERCELSERENLIVVNDLNVKTETKLVNPRKIKVITKVIIDYTAYSLIDSDTEIIGSETLEDDMSIQRKYIDVECCEIKEINTVPIAVSHDIELDGGFPSISEIIFTNMSLSTNEAKGKETSINLKTNVCVQVIYKSNEGNIFSFEKSFTLDSQINSEYAENYEYRVINSYDSMNSQIGQNSYGESKIIELDFVYYSNITGYKNHTVSSIADMYSVEYESGNEYDNSQIVSLNRFYNSSLSVNASESRESIGADKVRSVMLADVKITESNIKYNSDKRKITVDAISEITLACENNILDENDERYSFFIIKYPFKCEIDSGEDTECVYNCVIKTSNIRCRADSTKLYCDFEAYVNVISTDTKQIEYVKCYKLMKDKPINRNYSPITLCYPIGCESIWDIAKYYKTTDEIIMKSNLLTENNICDKKVLIIPSLKRKKA